MSPVEEAGISSLCLFYSLGLIQVYEIRSGQDDAASQQRKYGIPFAGKILL